MLAKRFCLVFLLIIICSTSWAQTVKVKKEKSTVKGEAMEGYSVELQASLAEVTSSFSKFLKTLGKVKQGDYFTVNEPNINGLSYQQPLFGVATANGKSSTAWLGVSSSGWEKADLEKVNKELEKLIKDFGVKFYRDQIQLQIDESTQATQAVEKQQQRLMTENKNLSNKLEYNKKEKIQLEKSLEANKVEHENLLKRLDQNKKAQDSVAIAAQQIKKVAEMHKERQRKVN